MEEEAETVQPSCTLTAPVEDLAPGTYPVWGWILLAFIVGCVLGG